MDITEVRMRLAEKQARDRKEEDHIAALLDDRALAYMRKYFGCDAPAFLPDDKFDEKSAMRRDSFRAFYLTLRRWRNRWKKENN